MDTIAERRFPGQRSLTAAAGIMLVVIGGLLLAGGGFRGGFAYGETDEWGWDVVKDPVHVHDVQATVLYALGLDHLRLVTRYQGRDFRLTDVAGNVVKGLLA